MKAQRFLLLVSLIGSLFAANPPQKNIALTAPLDYQVVQRQSLDEGMLPVSGKVNTPCDKIELRLDGKDRKGNKLTAKRISLSPNADYSFTTQIKIPAGGWYVLYVRALKNGKTAASSIVPHVGAGEVFVGAGQSNSTNSGGVRADTSRLSLDGRTKSVSGLVSSFDGSSWRLAKDPQPGVHDNSSGGSFWPAFGDAMANKFKIPIGVSVTGHGGTSAAQWIKGAHAGIDASKAGLYEWTLTRINQLGKNGFRAVMWHQGESDYLTPADVYAERMENIISNFRKDAAWDMPWFVAHASFCPGKEVVDANSRGGQKILWDQGIALEGPDTDKMLGDLRDLEGQGIHFSRKGLKAHGEAWAEKVGSWLEKQLSGK